MVRPIVFATILGATLVSCGGARMGPRFVVMMEDASGLAAGAPVYIHGVRVGTVQSAKLEADRARVEFDVETNSGAVLKRDACASAGWYSGSLAPHLKLDPGSAAAPALPNGGEVTCVRATGTLGAEADKAMAALRKVLESAVEGKGTVARLLKDEELAARIAAYYAKPADAPAAAPVPADKPEKMPGATAPKKAAGKASDAPDLVDPFGGRR